MIKSLINKMCLLTLSTSVLLACQPELPTPDIDNGDDVRGNCSVYGHRKLANLGLPFNRFSGSYFSKKILRTKTSNYEWYPLHLSISESSSSTGKGQGSNGSTTQQCEEVLDLLLNRQYLSADEQISDMDIKLTYPSFKYETIFEFDEDNVEAKIETDVTPSLSIHFEVLEPLLSGSYRVISEKEIDVGPINCETSFRIVAGWEQSDFDNKIHHEAQDSNMSGEFFHFLHEAEFTGENCTFEFEDTFQLRNNQLVPTKVFGGLEMNMEDGEQKGYDFVVYGIEI